ncbi:MAG: hypothetical protein ABIP64_01095 [Burkholderiales bacterium]
MEATWAYLKQHEIANLCCNTIGEVGQFARNRLKSMQRRSHLITLSGNRLNFLYNVISL